MLKVYTFLSKFPFNFGIFKKSKIIVGYIYGDTKIEELIKVCSKKDISRILDYFVKKDDYKKITELLAYAPELLSIEKYSRFWMDVLKAYPEKALTVLEYAPSNEARIIKEVLVKKGIVSLDLEIISEKIVACGLVFFSPNDEEAILFFDEYEINYLKKFLEFLFSFDVTIIGHNILQFDIDKIVKLVKLQEKNLPKRIVDTLYLHSLVEPGEKSRALSDLVTHTGHNPIEDARASIKLLKQLITKIKQYNLEIEALELLKDNPYLTGIENILLNYFRDSTVSNSEQVIQKTSIRIRDAKTKDLLYVVKNWKGLAEPWSPNILTPRKFKAKSVWEKAAVFSALCALNDIYCGKGDPETFRNTWCIDKNTLKAIVSVSKCYTKRELFEKPVETLPKYISEIEDQFAEVHIVDGDILIPRKTFNRILPKLKKLSSNIVAYTSLANEFSKILDTNIEFVDNGFKPKIFIPENSSLDVLNISSNLSALPEKIELPMLIFTNNEHENEIIRNALSDYHVNVYELKGRKPFLQALEAKGVTITNLKTVGSRLSSIPTGFKTLVIFSDRNVINIVKGKSIKEKLIYSFMYIFGIARELGIETIAYLSFITTKISDYLGFGDYGLIFKNMNLEEYGRKQNELSCVKLKHSLNTLVKNAEKIVRDDFNIEDLRPCQRKALALLLSAYAYDRYNSPFGIVILPTGTGKSLIFQSAALLLHRITKGVTIVISPLQALIQDQVENLKRKNVNVAKLDSTVDAKERKKIVIDALLGNLDIVYVTPERFEKEEIEMLFDCGNINYVILDEIHCLSKWGNSFRPSYRVMARKLVKEAKLRYLPIYGFSATLPKAVLEDIIELLEVQNWREIKIDLNSDFEINDIELFKTNVVLRGPVTRPELKIDCIKVQDPVEKRKRLLKKIVELKGKLDEKDKPWVGVIFAPYAEFKKREYENVGKIAEFLESKINEKVLHFHGRLDKSRKEEILETIKKSSEGQIKDNRIVVSTKAFGMGIDIPNIRFVIHVYLPDSLDDYYQEIGRGGRDRKKCDVISIFTQSDYTYKRELIKNSMLKYKYVNSLIEGILHTMDEQFVSQLIINKINKVAFLTHQVENYLKEETKKKEGRTIFRKILEVLKENELIDYTITTGRLAAYEILSEDVDLDEFSEPIVFVDYFKDSPVFIVDFNSPYVPIKSEVESLIKSLEKEEMIRRIKYRWKFYKYKNENGEVRYLSIDIPENKILKREMIYLTVKDSLDIKNVSLAKEFEQYQTKLRDLDRVWNFLNEVWRESNKNKNRIAHFKLKQYFEKGATSDFEIKQLEKIKEIDNKIEKLGEKAILVGLMGSEKRKILSELYTFYSYKYSDENVVVVISDLGVKKEYINIYKNVLGKDPKDIFKRNLNKILEKEVIIIDEIDLLLERDRISLDNLDFLDSRRKIYISVDPLVIAGEDEFNLQNSKFSKLIDLVREYNFNIVPIKRVSLPLNIDLDGLEVTYLDRKSKIPERHIRRQILKYIPFKYNGALVPELDPKTSKDWINYYWMLYLCLKASKYAPKDVDLKLKKLDLLNYVLTSWIKHL